VPVVPNGSFLAYLPVPPRARHSTRSWRRAALTPREQCTRSGCLPPRLVLADTGRLVVDSASVSPRGVRIARPDERVRVSIRAPRNATVAVRLANGSEQPLVTRRGLWTRCAYRPPTMSTLRVVHRCGGCLARAGRDACREPIPRSARFTIHDVTVDDAARPRWVRLTGAEPSPIRTV
jgi:hypothetical protein